MADLTPFKAALIRICTINQAFRGIGLLLKPNLAITCAHVVTDALGLPRTHTDRPTAQLKLNRPGFNAQSPSRYVTATVLPNGWFPREAKNGLADIALLTLTEPLTDDVRVQLSSAFSLSGLAFVAWGGQAGHFEHLIDITGTIGRDEGNGRYCLDVRDSNYKIRPGCSGAPVADLQTGLVLGLIVQEELEAEREAGFLIPARQLREALDAVSGMRHDFPKPQYLAVSGMRHDFPKPQLPSLEKLLDWSQQHYKAWWRKQADIVRFIQAYCHQPDDPKPFVGREVALQELDGWFSQAEQRLLLLSGAAGRGKSALLLHWLAYRLHADDCTVLFLPISIRFATNDEMTGVRLLHAALCDVFSELKAMPQKPELTDYLDHIYDAWDYIANRPEQRFLLVIDGIDEATNQWFVAQRIIPPRLPANLSVLLSARHKPEQHDGRAWLTDLGYSSEAHCLELSTLEKLAMAEAVVQLGHPLDHLAEREAFVTELYRLTDDGDPLLLSLWLGQIWQHRDKAPDFDTETLQTLQPSFQGFYNLWTQAQQRLWQSQGLEIHPEDFDWVMRVLAFAHAPLLLDELFDLLKRLPLRVTWEYAKLRQALESAHRLVIGDGKEQGYVLVHPRLAHYFRENVGTTVARQLHRAFLAWGAETVALLNQDKMPSDECPRYVLQQYVAHVKAAGLDNKEALDQHYLPLLEGGWHQAWQTFEGAWLGFLKDLRQVVEALQTYNRRCYEQKAFADMYLAMELRCALIGASIHTLHENLPVDLVVKLAKAKIWSFAWAGRVAEQYAEAKTQAECLTKLAAIAPEKESKELRQRALQAAMAIQDEYNRAQALIAVAKQLSDEEKQNMLQQALQVAMAIQNENNRAQALIAVAEQLQGEEKQNVLQQVLQAATAIRRENDRAEVLIEVAEQLQGKAKQQVLQQALQTAKAIQKKGDRADALTAVAEQLQGEVKQQVLQQARQAAMIFHSKYRRYKVSAAAEPDEEKQDILQQTLQVARAIQDEYHRVQALIVVAEQLPSEEKQQALQVARTIQDEGHCAYTLSDVVKQLPDEEKQDVLQQALQAAIAIQQERSRAEALNVVVGQLQGETELLQQALQAAIAIQNEDYRTEALIAVTKQLQGDAKKQLFQQTLQAVIMAIQDKDKRANVKRANVNCANVVLLTVAEQLRGKAKREVLQQALQVVAIAISDDELTWLPQLCIDALSAVAGQSQGEKELLQQALQMAITLQNEFCRTEALSAVVTQLQGETELLKQALQAAIAIQSESCRAEALSAVAKQLQGETELLQETLQATTALQDEGNRAKVLSAVVTQLQSETELLKQALQVAIAIQSDSCRAEALNAVAGQLQGNPELQKSCLKIALNLPDEWIKRIIITAELTRQNTNLLTYDIWADWLQHVPRKRAKLLEFIGNFTQIAVQFTGNPNQAAEVARAIIDVGRWWP